MPQCAILIRPWMELELKLKLESELWPTWLCAVAKTVEDQSEPPLPLPFVLLIIHINACECGPVAACCCQPQLCLCQSCQPTENYHKRRIAQVVFGAAYIYNFFFLNIFFFLILFRHVFDINAESARKLTSMQKKLYIYTYTRYGQRVARFLANK